MNSTIKVGYACLNLDLDRGFKTCRFANLTNEKWIELISWNLETLKQMLIYTADHNIQMLRLSSDLIPFATKAKDDVNLDWQVYFQDEFDALKKLIKNLDIRISFHPGQYTVLNSPKEDVVERAIADLDYHTDLLALLGGDQSNKMVIHIGGVYGDKDAAIQRFIQVANSLSSKIRRHLIIENDERLFNIEDVLYISQLTHLPVVFDNLHFNILKPENSRSMKTYIELAGQTWTTNDGRQAIHYSQQALGKKPGAHTRTTALDPFIHFIQNELSGPIDIMLEVKDKNRSAEKIQLYLDQDIGAAEKLWARYKYAVMAKSLNIYQAIRELLKDKENTDFEAFIHYLETAENLPEDIGNEINAGQHIWGYFKKQATDTERGKFKRNQERLQNQEISITQFRRYLKQLLKKYPNPYLTDSIYFKPFK